MSGSPRPLADLVNTDEPAIDLIREWAAAAANPCEILPPSERRADVLLGVQVTTRSPLGALAYETGGVFVDGGWLRFLGSGNSRIARDLVLWNQGRSDGFYLVADDAVGGFFALNGGALGDELHHIYYWPPDGLEWESCGMGFTAFFQWALTDRIAQFYEELRWPTWKSDVAALSADRCFAFYPFLWTTQGSVAGSHRADVPATEAFDLKVDIIRQLSQQAP